MANSLQDYQQKLGDFIFTVNIGHVDIDLLGASKQTTVTFRNRTVRNIEPII
jgi:hypothetical protein